MKNFKLATTRRRLGGVFISDMSSKQLPRYAAAEQAYYEVVVREVQERASVSNLLDLTQFAFRSCVHNFVHHELTNREEKCLAAVSKKYIAVSIRATSRLAESQAAAAAATRAEAERAFSAASNA